MPTSDVIETAATKLVQGSLVAIPTETVYGLAADASSKTAVAKIFKAKGRPNDHPLIVHIAKPTASLEVNDEESWAEQLAPWARDIPTVALTLAKSFWPGPLTMILPRAKNVLYELTGGQETVGLRCPDHPVAQALLTQFKGAVAAPSANRFGRVSPTSAQHVVDEFSGVPQSEWDEEIMVLDGGLCSVGIESTIVDLTRLDDYGPIILRPGVITKEQIEKTTGMQVGKRPEDNMRHSGGLSAHYAPKTRLLIATSENKTQLIALLKTPAKIAWLAWEAPAQFTDSIQSNLVIQTFPKDNLQAAKSLYQLLRELDAKAYDYLVFPKLPDTDEWAGVRDRLQRAAVGSGI